MTLTEFLTARLDEDEAEALTSRAWREVEAKRAIVAMHEWDETEGSPVAWATELRALAAVYADHPDYDEVWRA